LSDLFCAVLLTNRHIQMRTLYRCLLVLVFLCFLCYCLSPVASVVVIFMGFCCVLCTYSALLPRFFALTYFTYWVLVGFLCHWWVVPQMSCHPVELSVCVSVNLISLNKTKNVAKNQSLSGGPRIILGHSFLCVTGRVTVLWLLVLMLVNKPHALTIQYNWMIFIGLMTTIGLVAFKTYKISFFLTFDVICCTLIYGCKRHSFCAKRSRNWGL